MKFVVIVGLLVGGCYAEIEGSYDENVRDHDIDFRYTTPIAVGQVGRNWVTDGCVTDAKCSQQDVGIMNVAIDHPEVISASPMMGAKAWDATALAPGSAMVSVMADNEGVERRGVQVVEVLAADTFELVPAGLLARAGAPSLVAVPRTCASLRFTTNGLGTFAYKLKAGTKVLKGSGYYPFASDDLTPVTPYDRGADGGGLQFIAGATPATSTITSTLPASAPVPVEVIESGNLTAVTLSDAVTASTGETVIFADVLDTNVPVCFDNNTRAMTSMTPSICTVRDGRPLAQQNRGAGPYVIDFVGPGTCTIKATIQGTTLTATKDYTRM